MSAATPPHFENRERVLVIDDEAQMRSIVTFALETQGFTTASASNATAAWELINHEDFSLVILDIMLPDTSGITLCQRIRAQTKIPVILLTALGEEDDRVLGLEAGADDYVTKPFSPRELALRAVAVLRRYRLGDEGIESLRAGHLEMDPQTYRATWNNQRLDLSQIESRLLLSLLRHKGQVVSPHTLLNEVWGTTMFVGGKEVVKTTVYRLRRALRNATGRNDLIQNIRSEGYLLSDFDGSANQS